MQMLVGPFSPLPQGYMNALLVATIVSYILSTYAVPRNLLDVIQDNNSNDLP